MKLTLTVMPLSTSVLFFASLSLELDYIIKGRISIRLYIDFLNLYIDLIFILLEDSRPTSSRSSDYACSSPTIHPYHNIMERGTFELICNGSKRPLVGLICDWSRRPRGHITYLLHIPTMGKTRVLHARSIIVY